MPHNPRSAAAAFGIAAATLAGVALAQAWPAKPIRIVSPFPTGGGSDILARQIAPRLADSLKEQVLVENRTGAAGNVGAEFVAKSAPDGYTFLMANNTVVINPSLQKTPFDVVRDFQPVGLVGSTPIALAVHPSIAANNVQEFIALARAQPGRLSYSSCGNGTAMHLAGELFKQLTQTDLVHIPYRGCGPAVADGVGGQVPVLFNTITNTMPQARGGKLKVLGIASATRSPVDRNTPTIAEAAPGLKGFDADIWFGLLAPAGTPREIVNRLNAEVQKVLAMPEVRQRLVEQLFDLRTSTPEQFAEVIRTDLGRWAKVVRENNIKPD